MTTKVYPLPCATSRLRTALFHSLRRQWLHLATGSGLELGLRGRHPRWRPCFWAISLGTVLQFLSLFFGHFCPSCLGSFVPLWGIFVPLEKNVPIFWRFCPYLLGSLSLTFGSFWSHFWFSQFAFLNPLCDDKDGDLCSYYLCRTIPYGAQPRFLDPLYYYIVNSWPQIWEI